MAAATSTETKSEVKTGTIKITKEGIEVIWEDAPYNPEPFPLIFLYPLKKSIIGRIEFSEETGYEIRIEEGELNQRNVVWPGEDTLKITKDSQSKSKGQSKSGGRLLFDTPVSQTPLEEAQEVSKNIVLNKEMKQRRMNVIVEWDPNRSVMCHPGTGEIVGVTRWLLWRDLVLCDKSKKFVVDLKWNPLTEKYQVDTIKRQWIPTHHQ